MITAYNYDPAANPTRVWTPAAITTTDGTPTESTAAYRADNSLAATGGATYSYDEAGRTRGDGCTTHGYDGFDRPVSTTTGPACGAATSSTTYDPLGRIIRTVDDRAGTTGDDDRRLDYVSLGTDVALDIGSTTRPQARYAYAPDGPVAAAAAPAGGAAPAVWALGGDGRANVVRAARAGTVCEADFDPWGNPTTGGTNPPCGATTTPNNLWYQSAHRGLATGTYDYGARTYNPTTGTWLTADFTDATTALTDLGIGTDPATANRYNYVNGDPINLTDPTGHGPCYKRSSFGIPYLTWCGDGPSRVAQTIVDFGAGVLDTGGEVLKGLKDAVLEPAIEPITVDSVVENVTELPVAVAELAVSPIVDAFHCGEALGEPGTAYERGQECATTLANRVALGLGGRGVSSPIDDVLDAAAATAPRPIGPAGNPGAFPNLSTTQGQVQSKFTHTADFGVTGNYSPANAALFDDALRAHVGSSGVRTIPGTYRGQSVIHSVDPVSGLNVIRSPSGQFISGRRLNPDQLQNVLTGGSL